MSAPRYGKVTPPDDLQPAIDALGPRGREYLDIAAAMNGGKVTPFILAKAADHGRENGES